MAAGTAARVTTMTFDLQPVLQGEHLTLRPLVEGDFEALFAVASDPLIWKQHPVKDRYQREVFAEFFADALACGGALIVLGEAGDVIGSSRFHGYDEQRGEVEIGWTFLARSCWGGTVNGELKALMLGHAFRYVDRVVFLVGPRNQRSQRALAKTGATLAGVRADASGSESLLFALERGPWTRGAASPSTG